jgi:hypothetical protein
MKDSHGDVLSRKPAGRLVRAWFPLGAVFAHAVFTQAGFAAARGGASR